MGQFYKHSNKFNPILSLLFFILGVVVTFLFMGISAIVGNSIFPPYTTLLMVFLFSILLYVIQKAFIKWSKNRNLMVAVFVIMITSLLGFVFHLSAFISTDIIFGYPAQIPFSSPGTMFGQFADVFIGSLGLVVRPGYVISTFVNRGSIWIIYLAVSAICLLVFPLLAINQTFEPYDNISNQWLKEVCAPAKFQVFAKNEEQVVVDALRKGDVSIILNRQRYANSAPPNYSRLLFLKANDSHSGYVGIMNFTQNPDKKGRYTVETFMPPMQIDTALAHKLEAVANPGMLAGNGKSPTPVGQREVPESFSQNGGSPSESQPSQTFYPHPADEGLQPPPPTPTAYQPAPPQDFSYQQPYERPEPQEPTGYRNPQGYSGYEERPTQPYSDNQDSGYQQSQQPQPSQPQQQGYYEDDYSSARSSYSQGGNMPPQGQPPYPPVTNRPQETGFNFKPYRTLENRPPQQSSYEDSYSSQDRYPSQDYTQEQDYMREREYHRQREEYERQQREEYERQEQQRRYERERYEQEQYQRQQAERQRAEEERRRQSEYERYRQEEYERQRQQSPPEPREHVNPHINQGFSRDGQSQSYPNRSSENFDFQPNRDNNKYR